MTEGKRLKACLELLRQPPSLPPPQLQGLSSQHNCRADVQNEIDTLATNCGLSLCGGESVAERAGLLKQPHARSGRTPKRVIFFFFFFFWVCSL